jgi:acyl-CoA thioesterase
MYAFDEDTHVELEAPGVFSTELTSRWNIDTVPNGGYVLAIGLAAVGQVVSQPDPLTTTAHYLRPTLVGPATIEVTTVRQGRQHATAMATLSQEGKERVRYLATYGDLSIGPGPKLVTASMPTVNPLLPGNPEFRELSFHFNIQDRFDVEQDRNDTPDGSPDCARSLTRMRFSDGREPDVHSLAVFADAFPPPIFRLAGPSWVPTMELTVHFRARPKPGWLTIALETQFLFNGYLEEDAEIWDESGQLVALSRQMASSPRPF